MDPRITELVESRPVQASLERSDGRPLLTMVRDLDADPARVWAAITEPAELARWSPIVPDRALTSPGPALAAEAPGADPVACDVAEADAPHALVHRWGDHALRWGVVDLGDGRAQLGLQESLARADEAADNAAGWHLCLAVLEGVLAGLDVPRVVGPEAVAYGWEDLRDRYAAVLTDPGPGPAGLADGLAGPTGGGGGTTW